MSLIENKLDLESIDEFNDFRFDLESMVQQATEILDEQKTKNLMFAGDFESDEWHFICDTRHTKVYFNFKATREKLKFLDANSDRLILSLKCWIATLIPARSLESIRKYYKYVEDFLSFSRVFDEKILERTQLYLTYECDDRMRWNLCVPTLNFIDFYEEIDTEQLFKKMLVDIKKDIDIEKVGGMVRKLPPAQDVLVFSWIVENFFAQQNNSDDNYLRYYPIYIWWSLSNLIPMRPSEFCDIARDALSKENGRCYIRLPRLKQKDNYHKIQVVDKIAIPQTIYEQLQDYIAITDAFGQTATLISYSSIRTRKATEGKEYLNNRFRHGNFQFLLDDFYDRVIDNVYQMEYTQRLRPGDTRHFAFLNLMRQGYHPVEIARLGGHTSLQAQYHYQQHMEYWVDVEILQMMQRFNLHQGAVESNSGLNGNQNCLDDEFIREKVLRTDDTGFRMPVETGYCTDPNMYCQVDKCYFCDHWRISQEEYLLKRKEIENELKQCKNEVGKLIKTLNNLYSIALKESFEDDFNELSQDFNKDLFLTKSQLDEKVHRMMNFSSNLGNGKKGWK
jgi:integrase